MQHSCVSVTTAIKNKYKYKFIIKKIKLNKNRKLARINVHMVHCMSKEKTVIIMKCMLDTIMSTDLILLYINYLSIIFIPLIFIASFRYTNKYIYYIVFPFTIVTICHYYETNLYAIRETTWQVCVSNSIAGMKRDS